MQPLLGDRQLPLAIARRDAHVVLGRVALNKAMDVPHVAIVAATAAVRSCCGAIFAFVGRDKSGRRRRHAHAHGGRTHCE